MRGRRIAIGLSLLAVLISLLRERRALAAVMVEWSDLEHVGSFYFAPNLSAAERSTLLQTLEQAKRRVAQLYGPLRSAAPIIVADAARHARYADSPVAVTHYQPTGAVIVLGPSGRSLDVLAHELAHAELFARMGYVAIEWCTPTWFDEGLAVQFDERAFYSEAAFAERRAAGWPMPPLTELETRGEFFAGSRDEVRFHYAGARAAVGRWLRESGPEAARQDIASGACGKRLRAVLSGIVEQARQSRD